MAAAWNAEGVSSNGRRNGPVMMTGRARATNRWNSPSIRNDRHQPDILTAVNEPDLASRKFTAKSPRRRGVGRADAGA